MASTPPPAWPIAIAGAGPTGLALALALARSGGPAIAATVYDPALDRPRADRRAYALSAAAQDFLARLGVLGRVPGRPIAGMTITDSRLADAVRPAYLRFEAGREGPLGLMVEGAALVEALHGACLDAGVALRPTGVREALPGPDGSAIALDDGSTTNAALVVACDGARSRLREAAGIGWAGGPYRQAGLVATVRHALDHRGWAVQHFLPAGPFAILPLPDGPAGEHRSSIVWTERQEEARRVAALPPERALADLEARFGPERGSVTLLGPIATFPLSVGLARAFTAPRLALVGDAAHEIHPLAGQGLNLALVDADALAGRVRGSVTLGLDPGRPDVLRAYGRDRRADAVALAALTDGLNRLFSNESLPLRALRDIGLGLVDRAPALKAELIRRAAGRG